MKKNKIIYWSATGLFSVLMLMNSVMYFTVPEIKDSFVHLGFPDYFRIQLGAAKFLGTLAILLPFIPKGFKIFAYAGFCINLLSASFAHAYMADGAVATIFPLLYLIPVVVSYIYFRKLDTVQK